MPKILNASPAFYKSDDGARPAESFEFSEGVFFSFYVGESWQGCISYAPSSIDADVLKNEFLAHFKSSDLLDKIKVKAICSKRWESQIAEVVAKCGWELEKVITRSGPFTVVAQTGTGKLQLSKEGVVVAPIETKPVLKVSKMQPSTATSAVPAPVKVLVVDDSPTIRNLLKTILSADPRIQVVALAEKPSDVEALINKYKPDVMTLDIHMPEMDGVTLLKGLLPKYAIPTIMISSISKEEGPYVLNALSIGAVDYIQKPNLKDLDVVAPQIVERVFIASKAKIGGSKRRGKVERLSVSLTTDEHLIVMGSSTGGTEALREVLERMPAQIPPILVVQHIPAVFSKALAERLNDLCPFEVREAQDGDIVSANTVYIAPGGKQMGVVAKSSDVLRLTVNDEAPVNRHKPSVDFLFDDVVKLNHRNVVGVIMTGMGADGARGLKKLRDQGARTIAQDEKTCVVFGMPREAIALGAAEFISPLDQIAQKISDIISQANVKRKVG